MLDCIRYLSTPGHMIGLHPAYAAIERRGAGGAAAYSWRTPFYRQTNAANVSYVICEQQRCKPACASAQSDQRLCCSRLR